MLSIKLSINLQRKKNFKRTFRLAFLRVIKKFFLSAVLAVLYIIPNSSHRTLGDLFCFIFNILKVLFSNQYEL